MTVNPDFGSNNIDDMFEQIDKSDFESDFSKISVDLNESMYID